MLLQVRTTPEEKQVPFRNLNLFHMHTCSFVKDKVTTSTKQTQESVPPSDTAAGRAFILCQGNLPLQSVWFYITVQHFRYNFKFLVMHLLVSNPPNFIFVKSRLIKYNFLEFRTVCAIVPITKKTNNPQTTQTKTLANILAQRLPKAFLW